MAEELQGGFSGSNLWSSSIRCGDMLSCSMAVGDIGGSFGWFPSTAEIVDHLSNAESCCSSPGGTLSFHDYYKPLASEQVIITDLPAMDLQPDELLGFDDISNSSVDWSQSFLESSETCNFQYAAVLGGEEHASTSLMNYREASHDDTTQMPIGFSSVVDHQSLFDTGDARPHICAPSSIEQDDQSTPKLPNASPITDFQQDFKNSTPLFWNDLANNNGRSFTPSFLINSDATEKPNSKASRDSMLPSAKKLRIETASTMPTFKVRKEKLGDRITALQQLVSPFGKTDTASVLHEAVEYIKFLHEQVGALSNPYLRNGHQRNHQHKELTSGSERMNGECTKRDLRSRGLCLVPFAAMLMVPNEIPPVDFWAQLWRKSYR